MKKIWVIGLMAVVAFAAFTMAQVPNPDTFVLVTIGDRETLDPSTCYDTASGEGIYNIYDNLIEFVGGDLSKIQPMLATVVPTIDNGGIVPLPDGGQLVTFPIRKDVMFHEAQTLTPADVEYTFERYQVNDSLGGPQWMLFNWLYGAAISSLNDLIEAYGEDDAKQMIQESVEVVGDSVVFKMLEPFPAFMTILAHCAGWSAVMNKEWCIENGAWPGTWDFKLGEDYRFGAEASDSPLYDKANGTGPYKLVEWKPLEETTFEWFPDYWKGWEGLHVKDVVIKSVDEWSTRKLMFEQGDADICYVPRQYRDQMIGTPGIRTIYNYPTLQNQAAMFNAAIAENSDYIGSGKLDGKGVPPDFFADVHIRKAFNYCFDWDTYIEQVWLGEAGKAWSAIPASLPYVLKDPNNVYTFDLEKAAEEFKAAWDGEVWEKGFKITLEYNLGNDQRKVAEEILELNIESLNPKFQVEVIGIDWPIHLSAIRQSLFAVHITGWLADFPHAYNFAYPYYHENGTFMAFQSLAFPELTTMIEESATLEGTAAEAKFAKIQRLAYDLAPGIAMVDPYGRTWQRTWVGGWFYNPMRSGLDMYCLYKAEGAQPVLETALFPDMTMEEW